jgi:hypothetical protein
MIEAVSGLQQNINVQDVQRPQSGKVEFSVGSMQTPSDAQASDFTHLAASNPVLEVNAAPASAPTGWTSGVASQIDGLASQLRVLDRNHNSTGSSAPSEPPVSPEPDSKEVMASAVSQMERAYMIAIEATMASRGSTETTKIFNTLLKGQ